MNRWSFTLIKLLVVIVVVGILAAILLTALDHSKTAAKRIHCVGNIRQLSLATHLYVDDHADRLPPAPAQPTYIYMRRPGYLNARMSNWDGYLDQNTDVFQCAANSSLQPVLKGFSIGKFNFAYGWNAWRLAEDFSNPFKDGRSAKLGRVVSSSDCLVLGDASGWAFVDLHFRGHGSQDFRFPPILDTPSLSPNPEFGVVPDYTFYLTRRHSGKANIAFLDGHVEALTLRELTLPMEAVHCR